MCNTTVYQFLSGFLVGVVLCFWVVGFVQDFHVRRNPTSSNERFAVPVEVAEHSVITRLLRGWFKPNGDNINVLETPFNGSKYRGKSLHFKNKTVITCLVPLLSGRQNFTKLESEIILKWVGTCDHVVFIHQIQTYKSDRSALKSVKQFKKFLLRRNIEIKISITYFSVPDNSSNPGQVPDNPPKSGQARDNPSESRQARDNSSTSVQAPDNSSTSEQAPVTFPSQYKALQFASMKYPDTSLFIVTPTATEVVTDFFELLAESSRDISNITENIGLGLSASNTINRKMAVTLNNFVLLGKCAVSSLIKLITSNKCPLNKGNSFLEWASNCKDYKSSLP